MLSRLQFSIILGLAIVLGMIIALVDFPFWMLIIAILLITAIVAYLPMIMNLYMTEDMKKVERFIEARLNQPVFHFYYALANEDAFQVEKALREVRDKYKKEYYHAIYSVTYAAYKGKLVDEKEAIAQIKQPALRRYYEALLAIEEGELERASELAKEQRKPWMKEAILAGVANKRGERDLEIKHQQEAIRLTRGLQRYLLVKKYEGAGESRG
jgi:NOL1/NOP2/fmu family ribosome biogenesis protein